VASKSILAFCENPAVDVGERFPVEDLGLPEGDGRTVVWFYPKAGTKGCSLEAAEFNRHLDRFEEAGVKVVGVSVDTAEENAEFAQDCGLEFPLVSDTGRELTGRLGLLKSYGEYGEFPERVTFLLDENGIVEELWRVEDIPAHAQEVLERATRRR
jgi:thioredoxin-dependent peroxiredoxin